MSRVSGQTKLRHYIAKEPTQQPKFLQKYPSYDGKGIIIAIIDSCIDVSLPGLQQTTTGLPKIIDCFDLTGNGDVDTATIREADLNGILIGLTGRPLKIPLIWKNPSGKWHLGIKSIYELCDKDALKSIIEFRKEKLKSQNQILLKNHKFSTKEDKKLMQKYLKSTQNLSNDSLVFDCIVWFDGEKWQACFDTSFSGNLEDAKVLTNYGDCHEYGIILDRLSYCVTIHENGNSLEIYATFIDHGTLIANVAAAHYPDEPEKDGLAPGAQIVSFAVIDFRNNESGNHSAVKKAFQKCLEMKVDIINYSLSVTNKDEYAILKEMAEKNGTIIVKAVGNDGPVYSSMDKNIQHFIFECGSCLTSDMVKALYDIDVEYPPIVSPFSSRGPASNESNGVLFLAPGHGIADIQKYASNEKRRFEATSFCAPNAVGAIACMLSGLKARNIPISFFKLKLALTNTAFVPDGGDKISFGNGILQIYDAFEFYQTNLKNFPETLKIISHKNGDSAGIVLRHSRNDITAYNRIVKINIRDTSKDTPKISWDLKVSANVEDFVTIFPRSDEFTARINTKHLSPNSVNYAEVHGYDSSNPSWGPLFKFPITVFSPKILSRNESINEEITLNSIFPYRIFVARPSGSYQCLIKLTILEEKNVNVIIQCSDGAFHTNEEKYLKFTPTEKVQTWCFRTYDDDEDVYEICFYQYMKSLETTKFNLEIKFIEILQFNHARWKESIDWIWSRQRLSFQSNLGCIKDVEICVIYDKIPFLLFAKDIECGMKNGIKFIKTIYYLTVTKDAAYQFQVSYWAYKWFQCYHLKRFNIFTLSKKFIFGFCYSFDPAITLKPGVYKIIGIYEYYGFDFFAVPLHGRMYRLGVVMNLKKPLKPNLYLKDSAFKKHETPIKKKITLNEGQRIQVFYNLPSIADLPFILPWASSLEGTCILRFKGTSVEFAEQQQYIFFICKNFHEVINAAKGHIQNYLAYINNIKNSFYQNINVCYDKQESTESYKSTIIDDLFVKATFIPDEYLKHCNNIPSIFKNNFGNNVISSSPQHPSIFQTIWSLICFNLNIKKDNFILPSKCFHILYQSMRNNYCQKALLSNYATSHKNPNKQFHDKEIKEACIEFLQVVYDTDIRKSLILIKQALIFGEFGTALFYLNKISKENHSLPEFKLFDEAIIELLKKLGWKHLIEAHENALLDRHRNYYRPL